MSRAVRQHSWEVSQLFPFAIAVLTVLIMLLIFLEIQLGSMLRSHLHIVQVILRRRKRICLLDMFDVGEVRLVAVGVHVLRV